jgi:hypothetical protein
MQSSLECILTNGFGLSQQFGIPKLTDREIKKPLFLRAFSQIFTVFTAGAT